MKITINKIIISMLIFLYTNFCFSIESPNEYPTSCQEAIDLVVENIDEESKKLLLSIEKEELQSRRFITGWGKGIRDGFGLTEGNFELMESCQALREDAAFHPINISGIIMEEVWQALRK